MEVSMKKLNIFFAWVCLCFLTASFACAEQPQTMTKQQRLENTVYLQDLNYSACVDGELCVIEQEDKTVKPHFYQNILYVPLRFVVEKLDGDVFWEDSVKTVILNIDGNRISLSTRYDTFSYNGVDAKLKNECFIKDGFTYVAFYDLKDLGGFETYFYSSYNAGVVYKGEQWNCERDAEKQAHEAMEFAVSPFFKMFIN